MGQALVDKYGCEINADGTRKSVQQIIDEGEDELALAVDRLLFPQDGVK